MQEKEKAWLVKKVLNDKECNFIKNYFFMKKRVLDFRLANKVSSIFQEKKYKSRITFRVTEKIRTINTT